MQDKSASRPTDTGEDLCAANTRGPAQGAPAQGRPVRPVGARLLEGGWGVALNKLEPPLGGGSGERYGRAHGPERPKAALGRQQAHVRAPTFQASRMVRSAVEPLRCFLPTPA